MGGDEKLKKKLEHSQDSLRRVLELLDLKIEGLVNKIEELDQEKTYYVNVKDYSQDEMERVKDVFSMAFSKIKWTPPRMIFSNQEIKEVENGY